LFDGPQKPAATSQNFPMNNDGCPRPSIMKGHLKTAENAIKFQKAAFFAKDTDSGPTLRNADSLFN